MQMNRKKSHIRCVYYYSSFSHSLTDFILQQLIEHLKAYFNGDWKTQVNVKQTMAITANTRVPLKKTLQDPDRSTTAPLAAESSIQLHSVPKGFRPIDAPTFPSPSLPPDVDMQPASHNPPNSALIVSSASSSSTLAGSLEDSPGSPVPKSAIEISQILSRKRAAEASTHAQPAKRQRQPRSCR